MVRNFVKKKLRFMFVATLAVALLIMATAGCSSGKKSKTNDVLIGKDVKVGDTVKFGSYEQDNNTENGKEEIEWIVLERQDNKALLISKYALDAKRYNDKKGPTRTSVTWETCTLRDWLNNDFLNEAFGDKEKTQIATTNVSADKNPEYSTNPGNATKDKVFLLSISEAEKCFSNKESRKCAPTAYAKAQGAWTHDSNKTANGEDTSEWWLRSPGQNYYNAASIIGDGDIFCYGLDAAWTIDCAVRPAMWVNLES